MKKVFLLGFIIIIMILTMAFVVKAQPPGCTDTLNFSFSGFVQNSTWNNVTGANVSVYKVTMVQGQPPTKTLENSTLTDANGYFNVTNINGSCSINLEVVAKQFFGSSNVSETSPILPPMPKVAYTDMLNGGTFYLQPAATLRITAVNSSGSSTTFAYVVMDDSFGMPLGDNMNSLVTTVDVTVPRDRNYTIVMMRPPDLVTDPLTATPPLTTTVNNLSDYSSLEYVAAITKNMSFSRYNISGYVNVTGNTTNVNLSDILIKFSVGGLVPDGADVKGLSQIIQNQPGVADDYIAYYNVQVLGSSDGIEQVVEFYARNITNTSNVNGEYFAFFQNFTVTGNIENFNVTLTILAGNYTTSTNVNTSMITINLTDGDQGGVLQDIHAELYVVNKGNVKTFRYMKDSLSSGAFNIPLLLNSNATLKVFSNKFAPLEKKINLTNLTNSSPILTIAMKGFNMESMGEGSTTPSNFSANTDIRVRFMKNIAACNVYEPDVASCKIGDDRDGGFNPLMAMMAGKSNIRVELTISNVTLYFVGVDLLASGPPAAVMSNESNEDTTADKSVSELWKFGSMAPDIYDEVRIGIPYNESKMNETRTINITLKYLYDNDWNIIWNASNDPNAANIPSDYSDFNVTWFNVSSTGMPCTTSATSDCFVNTSSNVIWIRIPHFSSGGYYINTSSVDQTPPTTNATLNNVNDTDDADGNINLAWTDDANESSESYRIYRHTSEINSSTIGDATLIASNFPNSIQYYEDNSSTSGTNYWYALVTVDWTGNYNESVVSNSLNASANDSIAPKLPTQVIVSPSGGTNTISWTNVTQDVSSNYDLVNYTVWYWKNTTSYWNSTTWELINDSSIFTLLATNISANSTTHSVTDFPNNNSVRYYYFVTTIDDANNENRTYNGNNVNLSTVSAPTCSDGAISSTGCLCGGTFYKSGYCCSNVFGTSACTTTTTGGGGGGGGAAVTAYSASQMWATVLSGALTSMSIDNTNIAFTKLQFISSSTLNNAEIKVTALTSQPEDITSVPEDTLYQYLTVETENMPSDKLSSMMIYFRVRKSWVNSNNIDYKTIKLSRYKDDTWNKLITTYQSVDDTYYKFSASTPGFSYFAVTGIKKEEVTPEAPEAVAEEGVTNVTEAEARAEEEKIVSRRWLGWLIVVLIIGGVVLGVYFYQKRKEKPSYGFEQ